MHHTQALTFAPAATETWLRQSTGANGPTRAESRGVNEELFGLGLEGFLSTVDDVLNAGPDGLHRRADITDVLLWLIPDGDLLYQGALITVDLTNGVRLASQHQDIKTFADPQQRGIAAALSALAHIANQVCLLLDTYQSANPGYPSAKAEVSP